MFPERGRAIRLGRVNEKKWRLIDDDVVVSLIYDFEVEVWRNEVMDQRKFAGSKATTP